MNRLLRPSLLVLLSAGLAVVAAILVLWPRESDRAHPLPVLPGDFEIVWLNHATNIKDWERFISAARHARPENLQLEIDDSKAFPGETTEVPELQVGVKGKKGRLLFRWYKLTGDLKPGDWLTALMQRERAPLAIIGGSNSESALELARQLKDKWQGPERPLFFILQGTSDKDTTDPSEPLLVNIYPGRTFRFCFTNRQMATAVTNFVWSRDNLLPESDPGRRTSREKLPRADDCLRPDADPAYMAIWKDDPYSWDLADQFMTALRFEAVRTTALDFAWLSGFAGNGRVPIDLGGVRRGQFRMSESLPWRQVVFHSVGGFNRPNQAEEDIANKLLAKLAENREGKAILCASTSGLLASSFGQGSLLAASGLAPGRADMGPEPLRPLLVLPATSQPFRRFLRVLRKNAPVAARRFTVVTGDSIEFNKIYRDRNMTWPIQEMPFKVIFFCHRNPVDRDAGFREEDDPGDSPPDRGSPSTGTEDLLLFVDLVETVVTASYGGPSLVRGPTELAASLHQVRWHDVRLLFGPEGNRHGGTGEHVVYLRPPLLVNGRVAPRSEIEVWSRIPVDEGGHTKTWSLTRFLTVAYDGAAAE